jgi:hypothetical protein
MGIELKQEEPASEVVLPHFQRVSEEKQHVFFMR